MEENLLSCDFTSLKSSNKALGFTRISETSSILPIQGFLSQTRFRFEVLFNPTYMLR